jgi:acyl dehydratase
MRETTLLPARHGPFTHALDAHLIAAYADATDDPTAAAHVPVTLPLALAFGPQEAARADLPKEIWQRVRAGVHGEHDIVLHRPLAMNDVLHTWSTISAVRTTRSGTHIVVRLEQRDANGAVAVEQWWTMVLLGLRGIADLGTMPAEHRLPDDVRGRPIGSATHHIDATLAHRFAEVSGDWAAHHFDVDAARRAGVDFVFSHGLCTMAICTHRMLGLIGVDDPGRVRRIAVRFASPTPLDSELTVNAFAIDEHLFAFEAIARGVVTITHGRMELRR